MKLVHWPLLGGLLHLVQREAAWAGPQSAQAPLRSVWSPVNCCTESSLKRYSVCSRNVSLCIREKLTSMNDNFRFEKCWCCTSKNNRSICWIFLLTVKWASVKVLLQQWDLKLKANISLNGREPKIFTTHLSTVTNNWQIRCKYLLYLTA